MTGERGDEARRLWARSAAPARGAGRCPDASALAAFVDDGMSPRERALVEVHLIGCEACLALLVEHRLHTSAPAVPSPGLRSRARRAVGLVDRPSSWQALAVAASVLAAVAGWIGFEAGRRTASAEARVSRAVAAQLTFGLAIELRPDPARPGSTLLGEWAGVGP